MIITYWAAQFIPSGWMSVIFGLSPFMTAFMAAAILQERSLGWLKLAAYSFGVAGLMVMFMSAMALSEQALIGVAAMLLSTFIHALSAVWVKRIDAQLPAIQQISGGMLLSLPLYWASWYWLDGEIPEQIPQQTLLAVIYLGLIATTFGFALYYYVLKHLPATQVAMINLMTPVLSLWLGYTANQEPVSLKVIIGTGLIMSALLIHQIAERRQKRALAIN
jgi:drug/metabolite transporter (DMT)-like permease